MINGVFLAALVFFAGSTFGQKPQPGFPAMPAHAEGKAVPLDVAGSSGLLIDGPRPKQTPLKIVSMPKAEYPSQAEGLVCVQGIVRLKVEFLKTGEIGEIDVVSKLPFVTENAIEAARKIKFIPALLNGYPVTVRRVVEIRFSLY